MPYDIIRHPKYYKYKVCKSNKKKKTRKKNNKKSNKKKTLRKSMGTKRICFSKKWLTKKKAIAQKTAIILSELGIRK